MKIKNKRTIIGVATAVILMIATAVTILLCVNKSKNNRSGMSDEYELEKEYFRAFKEKDYDRLYELTYMPYIEAVAKKEGIKDAKAQVKDYYKFLNQKVEAECGRIEKIKQQVSVVTEMSRDNLEAVNEEFEYLGIDEKVKKGAYIELNIIYECERENTEKYFDYYAIEVEDKWYFYNIEIAPYLLSNDTEAVTDKTEENDDIKEHSIEFVFDYGTDKEKVILTKKDIKSATATTSDDDFRIDYIVRIEFTEKGKEIFAEETAAHVGEKLSVVCDGEVILEPTINCVITDGVTEISNFESFEEAQAFADKIK